MASTIAAITTGTGGVVTTADASGDLSLLSGVNTVVALTSTGVSVTGTLAVSGGVTLTTTLPVLQGGTGVATTTAYGVLAGGTTATGAFQNIGTGTSAQVLTSNGAGALPTFQAASGGVTTIGFGTTGLTPSGATSGAVTVAGTLAVANGGTGVTTSTGTGAGVHSVGPSISSAVMTTMASSVITSGTVQTTTSGSAIIFTGIPSWAKRINVMFRGVSTSGAANFNVQIGSGSVTATGYNSVFVQSNTGSIGGAASTTGFGIYNDTASDIRTGNMLISLISANVYVASYTFAGASVRNMVWWGGGSITLAGALDRVNIVTPGAFTAGSINILYE